MSTFSDPIFDPLAPEVLADPYVRYRRLREQDPVYWHGQLDSWVCTAYAEVAAVLADTEHFASDFRRAGDDIPDAAQSIQTLDPPEHVSIRRLMVAAMHRNGDADLVGRSRRTATNLLRHVAGGRRDLVGDVARPVALRTICDFLGVEPPSGERFERLSNAIVRSMDGGLDPARVAPGVAAREELSRLTDGWLATPEPGGYLAALRAESRRSPDVPRVLVANSVRTVLHAGYESVSRLLGLALGRVAADPDLVSCARSPADLDALVEELARLDGPVQGDARVCVADTRLGDHAIRRGQVVVLLLAAADRDPAIFPRPDAVDLRRPRRRHLAFGRGAHACLGAALGRATLRGTIEALRATGSVPRPAGVPRLDRTATLRGYCRYPVDLAESAPGDTEAIA